ARRPGCPRYNGAEHDAGVNCRPGTGGAVRVFTKGGSTCLRLDPGVVPVFPRTEYVVSARGRSRGRGSGRAAICARYLDRANAPLEGTQVRSDLVVTGPRDQAGDWRVVTCALT